MISQHSVCVCILAILFQVSAQPAKGLSPRIIDEEAVTRTNFYEVGILNGVRQCVGALINVKWVLTSAYCASGTNNLIVTTGSINAKFAEAGEYVVDKYIHPGYNPNLLTNDIALVELHTPVSIKGTQILNLPKIPSPSYVSESGVVSGWGSNDIKVQYSDDLKMKNVEIVDNSQCNNQMNQQMSGIRICTFGRSICHGDQGAPLVIRNQLVGVANSNNNALRCENDISVTFTNVGYYLPWIRQITKLRL